MEMEKAEGERIHFERWGGNERFSLGYVSFGKIVRDPRGEAEYEVEMGIKKRCPG